MKKLLLITVITVIASTQARSQCLAHVKYYASKMEILDTAMNQQGVKEEPLTFITYPNGFTGIRENEEEDSLHGVLKTLTCNWNEPYKNGKITMVCDVQGKEEDMKDMAVTIEAVDGKITILLRAKEQPEKLIRLVIDKYEEVK